MFFMVALQIEEKQGPEMEERRFAGDLADSGGEKLPEGRFQGEGGCRGGFGVGGGEEL